MESRRKYRVTVHKAEKPRVIKEKKLYDKKESLRKLVNIAKAFNEQAKSMIEKENNKLEGLKQEMTQKLNDNVFEGSKELLDNIHLLSNKIIKNNKALKTLNDLLSHFDDESLNNMPEKATKKAYDDLKEGLSQFKFYLGNSKVGYNKIMLFEEVQAEENKVEEARNAVEKAEKSRNEADVKDAKNLVLALNDHAEKDVLLKRLDSIIIPRSNADDARKAFDIAKGTLDDAKIAEAGKLISELPDGDKETKLADEFYDFKNHLSLLEDQINALELKVSRKETIDINEIERAYSCYAEFTNNEKTTYFQRLCKIMDYCLKSNKEYLAFDKKFNELKNKEINLVVEKDVDELFSLYKDLDDGLKNAVKSELENFVKGYNDMVIIKNEQNVKRDGWFAALIDGAQSLMSGKVNKLSAWFTRKTKGEQALEEKKVKKLWKRENLQIYFVKDILNTLKPKLYRNHDVSKLGKKRRNIYRWCARELSETETTDYVVDYLDLTIKISSDDFYSLIVRALNEVSTGPSVYDDKEEYFNKLKLIKEFINKAYNDGAIDDCEKALYTQEVNCIERYHSRHEEIIYDYHDEMPIKDLYNYYDEDFAVKKMLVSEGKKKTRKGA